MDLYNAKRLRIPESINYNTVKEIRNSNNAILWTPSIADGFPNKSIVFTAKYTTDWHILDKIYLNSITAEEIFDYTNINFEIALAARCTAGVDYAAKYIEYVDSCTRTTQRIEVPAASSLGKTYLLRCFTGVKESIGISIDGVVTNVYLLAKISITPTNSAKYRLVYFAIDASLEDNNLLIIGTTGSDADASIGLAFKVSKISKMAAQIDLEQNENVAFQGGIISNYAEVGGEISQKSTDIDVMTSAGKTTLYPFDISTVWAAGKDNSRYKIIAKCEWDESAESVPNRVYAFNHAAEIQEIENGVPFEIVNLKEGTTLPRLYFTVIGKYANGERMMQAYSSSTSSLRVDEACIKYHTAGVTPNPINVTIMYVLTKWWDDTPEPSAFELTIDEAVAAGTISTGAVGNSGKLHNGDPSITIINTTGNSNCQVRTATNYYYPDSSGTQYTYGLRLYGTSATPTNQAIIQVTNTSGLTYSKLTIRGRSTSSSSARTIYLNGVASDYKLPGNANAVSEVEIDVSSYTERIELGLSGNGDICYLKLE